MPVGVSVGAAAYLLGLLAGRPLLQWSLSPLLGLAEFGRTVMQLGPVALVIAVGLVCYLAGLFSGQRTRE